MSTENNKIIAKFMGLTIITDGISFFDTDYKPLKKYDSDWNWLMEVVLKINQLEYNRYSIRINQVDCKIYDFNNDKIIFDSFGRFNQNELIQAVYSSVVDFIKWHNQ